MIYTQLVTIYTVLHLHSKLLVLGTSVRVTLADWILNVSKCHNGCA